MCKCGLQLSGGKWQCNWLDALNAVCRLSCKACSLTSGDSVAASLCCSCLLAVSCYLH